MSIHIGSATLRDIVVGTKIKGMSGDTVWKPRIKLIKYIEVIYKNQHHLRINKNHLTIPTVYLQFSVLCIVYI